MKYAFIKGHRSEHRVSTMCHVLKASRGGYYDWLSRLPSARIKADQDLLPEIKRIYETSRRNYGDRKAWKVLNAEGFACGKHRVTRLRREAGIESKRMRRFRVSTENRQTKPGMPDLVKQQFQSDQPNRIWVTDFTFVRTRAGWLYLAVMLDLFSRKVVGWNMSDKADVELTLGALNMAVAQRRPKPGLIHHSDQGSQYTAGNYQSALKKRGMLPSMSRKGSPHDNAVAESFFSNLKNELIHHRSFRTKEQARMEIFDYIEVFYNRQRIHQTLGDVSPAAFEMAAGA